MGTGLMGTGLQRFFAAWLGLTRGPLQPLPADAARHAPGVGLVIGAFGALMLWAGAHVWPAPAAVGVALVAVAWLTRGRHERALEACGGTLALIALLGLKAVALHGLAVRDFPAALAALPLVHALSRAPLALQAGRDAAPWVALAWCLLAAGLAVAYGMDLPYVAGAAAVAAAAAWVVGRAPGFDGAQQPVAEGAALLALLAAASHS